MATVYEALSWLAWNAGAVYTCALLFRHVFGCYVVGLTGGIASGEFSLGHQPSLCLPLMRLCNVRQEHGEQVSHRERRISHRLWLVFEHPSFFVIASEHASFNAQI